MSQMINNYSLKYHRKRLKNFWKGFQHIPENKRSINWWIGCMKLDPMKAGKEAKSMIKDLIRITVLDKKISIEEGSRLWDMIKSEDQENQWIALTILKEYYPHAFIMQKPII